MGDKINNQDLTNRLIRNYGIERESADSFIREFFVLIEKALEKDRIVKIKGLGTFKLVDVDSRESINVNTGERFEIQGHTKVSYTPDTGLRDLINKPFAHFETVVLGDNVSFGNDNEADDDAKPDETADEDDDIIISDSYVETEILPEEAAPVVVIDEELPVAPFEEEEEPETIEPAVPEQPEIPVQPEEPEEPEHQEEITIDEEEDIIIDESEPETEEHILVEETVEPPVVTPPPVVPPVEDQPKKKERRIYWEFVVIFLVLALGAVIWYYNDYISVLKNDPVAIAADSTRQDVDSVPQIEEPQEDMPPAVTDTVESIPEQQPEVVDTPQETVREEVTPASRSNKIVVTPAVQPYYDPYKPVKADSTSCNIIGTKAHHPLRSGETLIQISVRYYGSKDYWPYLVIHNRDKIKNPNNVPLGTIIDIPELEKK